MKSNRLLKIVIISMVLIQVLQVWLLWRKDFFKKTDPGTAALYIAILSIVSLSIIALVYRRTKPTRGRGLRSQTSVRRPRIDDEAFKD